MLKVIEVIKKFGGLVALKNVNFSINRGEIVGLIGPNGAGKTTLVNVISGVYPPDSGKILFEHLDLALLKPDKICKFGVSRTFQSIQSFPNLTVLQNVMIGYIFGRKEKKIQNEIKSECRHLLDFVGLNVEPSTLAGSLTVIELKKLDLARALSMKPKLLILDELNTGLNPTESKDAINLIRKIRDQDITILIVEHLMKIIMEVCDRLVVLNFGEKIGDGTPMEISSNQKVIQAYLGESTI